MSTAPKRRWLGFNLRTMFVAFAVVAVWLGWNVRIVEQRQAVVESLRLKRRGYTSEYAADGAGQFLGPGGSMLFTWAAGNPDITVRSLQFMVGESNVIPPTASRPPWIRCWLGDRYYASIVLYNETEVEEIRRHFPEAIVLTLPREEGISSAHAKSKAPPKTKPEHSVLVRSAN